MGDSMDGETITAVAITATINVATILGTLYYLKGKVETMEKSSNQRFEDLKQYINDRFNDFYKMFNTRLRNIEDIVYREN